jgi:hypothetical protein
MASAIFDNAPVSLMTSKVNIAANSTSTFCVLGTVAPQKASWATYNDIKWAASTPFEIATVNGYALGGKGIATIVPTMVATVTGLKTSASLVFTTTDTITANYAIVNTLDRTVGSPTSTTTTNSILCYLGIGNQTVTNGTLTLGWNTNGIITWTVGVAQ